MITTYWNTKKCTGEEQVQKSSQQFQGSYATEIAQIKWLDSIEKHNGGCIIYYPLSKYNTVEKGCFFLIEDL